MIARFLVMIEKALSDGYVSFLENIHTLFLHALCKVTLHYECVETCLGFIMRWT